MLQQACPAPGGGSSSSRRSQTQLRNNTNKDTLGSNDSRSTGSPCPPLPCNICRRTPLLPLPLLLIATSSNSTASHSYLLPCCSADMHSHSPGTKYPSNNLLSSAVAGAEAMQQSPLCRCCWQGTTCASPPPAPSAAPPACPASHGTHPGSNWRRRPAGHCGCCC